MAKKTVKAAKTAKLRKTGPITAKMVCKNQTTRGNAHCAGGWINLVVNGDAMCWSSNNPTKRLFNSLKKYVGESVVDWNDEPSNRREEIAAKLNAFFRKMGLMKRLRQVIAK